MAGHSKFKNIMHRKGAQDQKRAKMFNKAAREIGVAAKLGGADPSTNPTLRSAIQNARSINMPKERVESAIRAVMGGDDSKTYEAIRYEGYGPGGTAIIVEALSDNRNRTGAEIRTAFSKSGGGLGEPNSVAFMFQQQGVIKLAKDAQPFDAVFEKAIEAGAEDVVDEGDEIEVITSRNDFGAVKEALESGLKGITHTALEWRPNTRIEVDEDNAKSILKLIDVLEDNDDVQVVFSNFDVSDEIIAKLKDL